MAKSHDRAVPINATEGTNLIEETFLKHPRNRGHRCRLHWKHHFRKLAIEQALKLDGDFETNFFEVLNDLKTLADALTLLIAISIIGATP